MIVRSRVSKAPAALIFPLSVLHRRYAVECEIGHGGCAHVFRAWDAQAAQVVAIKRAHLSQKSEELLLSEAELLAGLHHPAIPAFLEYFEEDGRCYLVEEWRAGTPMKRMRFFSLPKVLWIGRTLGDVLAYVHSRDLFHGDLAPGNVLLAEQALSLIDFGFARCSSDPPRTKGTPGYASPEQWQEGMGSAAGDIFSLGMLLGCALTDTTPEEVQRARSFSNLWDEPGDVPAELVPLLALLDHMIAATPDARPALAEVQQFLHAMERQLISTQG
jgi:serine/threonine protein kinase